MKEKISAFFAKFKKTKTPDEIKIKEKRSKRRSRTFRLFLVTIIAIVIAIVVVALTTIKPKEKETPKFSADTMLMDVLDIEELSSAKYAYNGVVTVSDKKGKDKYYVKYKGTVELGINFENIEIITNDENKEITIFIPKCEFLSEPQAQLESLEYIFVNEKNNKETVSVEAFKAANKDIKERASTNKELFETANENMITTIKALTEPVINLSAPDYILTVMLKEDIK